MRILIFFSGGTMLAIEGMDDDLDMRFGLWVLAALLVIYAVQDIIEFFKEDDKKSSDPKRIEAAKKPDEDG